LIYVAGTNNKTGWHWQIELLDQKLDLGELSCQVTMDTCPGKLQPVAYQPDSFRTRQ